MDLKIKDVAKLLGVSETTIRRWLADGKIPAYRLNHEYRFSLAEIENWMMSCKVNAESEDEAPEVESDANPSYKGGMQQFGLFRAIHRGGVYTFNVANKHDAIVKGATLAAKKLGLDAEVLADLLLDREKMMSTGLNNGIAVPHTRDCVLQKQTDMILVAYLENPIEFGALDGKPVHTLFFLFSAEDKRHLNLLAKLAHLSSRDEVLELLQTKPSEQKLLEIIKEWELGLRPATI